MKANNRASLYWSPETKARLKVAVEASKHQFRSVSSMTEFIVNQYMDEQGIPKSKRKLV